MSVVYVVSPPTEDDNRGKKIIIVLLSALLIVAICAGAFLLITKKSTGAVDAQGEVFLAPAAAVGSTPDPFSTVSAALPVDTSIALPATGPAPTAQARSASTVTSGGRAGLYGATKNKVACDVDKLIKVLTSSAAKASRWSSALNADPTLRWSGPTLDQSTVGVYLRNLTPTLLVSDTRLTATGLKTTRQAVMQRGTAVLVDKYGVPRVRCADNNPLTPPVPTKTAPKYKGKSWSNLNTGKLTVVQGNAKPITTFQVRTPAKPTGSLTTLPTGPYSCVTTTKICTTPSGTTKPAPGTTTSSTATSTTPKATTSPKATTTTAAPKTTTPAPTTAPKTTPATIALSKKAGSIDISLQTKYRLNGETATRIYPSFTGYDANSRVNFTCSDSHGEIYSGYVLMDASGANTQHVAYCQSTRPNFRIRDHLGKSVSVS